MSLVQSAFERASGAPLIPGNAVRVLQDASENYPAWLEAIRGAQRTILFENYIFEEDEVGTTFARALAERARSGVKVCFLRDWMGSRATASREFWKLLEESGVEHRVFNPPSVSHPLGWMTRDHRKMIAVDGQVAFVSGLCVSERWLGDPRHTNPEAPSAWRDTGVEIRGPAVAAVEEAFTEVWNVTGAPLPRELMTDPATLKPQGNVALRVVSSEPTSTEMFRLDQMIAAAAQRTLWLTDAYFVGFPPYVQALRAASRAGVDVRLLVPSTTDIAVLSPLSRSGYRLLLEAGVRIFEWNGAMIHAKTATSDGRWARVGSSNLNLASFIGNYELDVAIEDQGIAEVLEKAYLEDLSRSTEITLTGRRVRSTGPRKRPVPPGSARPRVGAARFAQAVGAAAASGTRSLGSVETGIERALAALLFAFSVVGFIWPQLLAYPLAALGVWFAIALLLRAERNSAKRRADLEDFARAQAQERVRTRSDELRLVATERERS